MSPCNWFAAGSFCWRKRRVESCDSDKHTVIVIGVSEFVSESDAEEIYVAAHTLLLAWWPFERNSTSNPMERMHPDTHGIKEERRGLMRTIGTMMELAFLKQNIAVRDRLI